MGVNNDGMPIGEAGEGQGPRAAVSEAGDLP